VSEAHQQPDPARDEARAMLRLIRAHKTATLLSGDRATPVRYVIDNATGALVAPVERELLGLDDYLLMIPDDSFDAIQIHAAPTLVDHRADESCDRHLAYHGVQDPSAWVHFKIFSAKGTHPSLGALVVDGDALALPNPLRAVEPRACKQLNADPLALASLCKRCAGVSIERPVAVGVDPDGFDVRAKFGIVRVELHPSIDDPDRLAPALAALLAENF
jgi:hypothetical protein